VCHVSLFEADAYTRWLGAQCHERLRLPTEFEWESVAAAQPNAVIADGNFVDDQALRPLPAAASGGAVPRQLFGDVWEWTCSSYAAYPGFSASAGAVGEYNGKFMVNQYVLRGGSCATPRSHIRASYRNFFPADARWQFMGLRLVRDEA
jgi:formylglycine-generating enzyme required for sulfatase activity